MYFMKGQCSWLVEGTNPIGVKCQCGKPTGFVMVMGDDRVLRRKYPALCAEHQVVADKRLRRHDALAARRHREENDAVTQAEDAIEAGQARWSETGSTRK